MSQSRKRLTAWIDHLGVRATSALVLAAAAIWGFLSLAGEVREGETTGFDHAVLLAFRVPGDLNTPVGPRWMQETARDITALGGFTVTTLVVVLATVILLMEGRRLQALIFAGSVAGTQVVVEVLKDVLGRARPDLVPHHDLVYSNSFPSGHSTMAPIVYLTLAAIVAAGERRSSVRWLLMGAAAALVIAVGLSRVYLGVHWPTDVLGGWILGAALALAASVALHRAAPTPVVKPDAPGAP